MKRRSFIKKASLASAAITAPFILPSGRLFAASGMRMSDHVVLVAFAGGVRQQESILQRYLDDSQSYPSAGNILYNHNLNDYQNYWKDFCIDKCDSFINHFEDFNFFPDSSAKKL